MAGSGPHQTSPHHVESANVHQQGELHNLEREKDTDNQQEGSLQTLHIGGSGYQRKGHAIHEQVDEKAMQREIDDLKKRLRQAQRKQSPSSSEKERLRRLALYAGDQAILQEIARKRRKQQSSLNKPRFMQRTFLSRI